MAPIAIGLAIAGSAVSAFGAIQQGKSAKKQNEYQAQISEINARIARNNALTAQTYAEYNAQIAENNRQASLRNAQVALTESEFEADRIRRKARRVRGAQIAANAASGFQLSGSTMALIKDTETQFELDVLATLYKGAILSDQYGQQAANDAISRDLAYYQGAAQSQSFLLQAGARTQEAAGYRTAASNSLTEGFINAGSTILTGASRVANIKAGFIID